MHVYDLISIPNWFDYYKPLQLQALNLILIGNQKINPVATKAYILLMDKLLIDRIFKVYYNGYCDSNDANQHSWVASSGAFVAKSALNGIKQA